MHNLLKAIFLVLAAVLAQQSLADTAQPACFAYGTSATPSCRNDAAVAKIENKFFVWGGKETLGCPTCDRRLQGLNSGGLYDNRGRLLEPFPIGNGPGPRFGAQAIWNRQALFIWGGVRRQDQRRLTDGIYEVRTTEIASTNSFYIPGARLWKRISVTDMPPLTETEETRADGSTWKIASSKLEIAPNGFVRGCWTETPVLPVGQVVVLCRVFDMPANSWGPRIPH